MTFVDDYVWALIDENNGNKFWVAVMDGEDLPEKKLVYPTPVARNMSVNQVEIKSDTRRLRATPSTSGMAYDEACKQGVYNVLKWKTADGYDWALIAQNEGNDFWVAVMAGEDLPITDYQALYEALKVKNDELIKKLDETSKKVDDYASKLRQIEVLAKIQ